eukprot:jgi/Ulvmu1/10912/UM007_0089.1
MSSDAFSDLTGLSAGPQPMRAKQTGMMKAKKSAANLLAAVGKGTSASQRPAREPAHSMVVHDLSDLEQPKSVSHADTAANAFDLFQDLGLPSEPERKKPVSSHIQNGNMLETYADVPSHAYSQPPLVAPTPPMPSASPSASATAAAVPDYHDLMSDAATSMPQRSGSESSSWSPRRNTQAVFFEVDDDPQHFPHVEPTPLPSHRSRNSDSAPAPPVPTAAPSCAPAATRKHPRPSLLDTSDAGLSRPELDSARTQFHTPAGAFPSEPSPADATAAGHDLLSGFGGADTPAADLLGADVFATPAATPDGSSPAEHGGVDFLGMAEGLAQPPPPADAGAAHALHDLLSGMGGNASHTHAPAAADDIDMDFFTGNGASAGPAGMGGPAAGAADDGWLMELGAAHDSGTGGTSTVRSRAAEEPEERGDVMLDRVVADAHGALATLPADRAQRVQVAIQQAWEYVEEQVAAKARGGGSTGDGLRYARWSAARTAAQVLEKLVAHHVRETTQEAEIAEASEYRDEIQASIKAWAFRGGTRRGLRNLLVDLDKVLWEGAVWKSPSLADVSSDAQLRKILNKARLLLHTDRMSGQPQKIRLRAELILIEIDKALKGVA